MNARTEEEVDSQIILDKVSKSTGSAYSFKERSEHTSAGPVVRRNKYNISKFFITISLLWSILGDVVQASNS